MRKLTFHTVWLSLVCVVLLVACTGGEGTTCFQNDECNGELICCHLGSNFTQGTCETREICDELQGGTGGTGGFGGQGGTGGFGGQGGTGGFGGQGGTGGIGGQGGTGGQGGIGGRGGIGGTGGVGGTGGQGGAAGGF